MEVSSKHIVISVLILFVLTIFTLYSINNFMKSEVKCESNFMMINKCGCMPNDGMYKLFNQDMSNVLGDLNKSLDLKVK
jgi:hypothetical protein